MAGTSRLLIGNFIRNMQVLQLQPKLQLLAGSNSSSGSSTFRHSSFQSSEPVRPLEEYPEVEVIYNAPEWKFVERLLPPDVVPKLVPKSEYPSGWKPPKTVNADQLKYLVARTKNHMVPVYLKTLFRGQRRLTVVRRVQGDIWALERDLRTVVEKACGGKLCASRVNEMSGQIYFHGDYVDAIREYLKENGF